MTDEAKSKDYGPDLDFHPADLSLLIYGYSLETGLNEVTEATLAQAIRRKLKATAAPEMWELEMWLEQIANCLDHPQAAWKLRLFYKKKGPRETYASYIEKQDRDEEIALATWEAMRKLGKNEAAIAQSQEQFGLSRASIFQSLKRWAKYQVLVTKVLSESEGSGIKERERRADPQYSEFLNWLDRNKTAKRPKRG